MSECEGDEVFVESEGECRGSYSERARLSAGDGRGRRGREENHQPSTINNETSTVKHQLITRHPQEAHMCREMCVCAREMCVCLCVCVCVRVHIHVSLPLSLSLYFPLSLCGCAGVYLNTNTTYL